MNWTQTSKIKEKRDEILRNFIESKYVNRIWIARRFCVLGLLVVPADFEDENKEDNAMFIEKSIRKVYQKL